MIISGHPYQRIPINAARAAAALQRDHIILRRSPIGQLEDIHRLRTVAERHTSAIIILGRNAILSN